MKRTLSHSVLVLFSSLLLMSNAHAEKSPAASSIVSKEWRSYIDKLAPIGEKAAALSPGPHDEQWRQELYQFLYSQIAVAYIGRIHNDPKYPDFSPMYNDLFAQGFPNPDDSYYLTPVDDDGVYKISGDRGSVRLVYFEVGSGTAVPYGIGTFGPSKAVYDIDTLKIEKDGSFEVILSPTRPAGYQGNWWKLDTGSTYLVVRQRHYDWIHEVDGRFAIERLDQPAAKPRPNAHEIEANLNKISEWVDTFARMSLDGPWVKNLRASGLVNKVKPKDYSQASGLGIQQYVEGLFEIKDDEALIVETEIPTGCSYWNFQLADNFWQSIEWVHHQSSLNGYTARLDADGKFRFVISSKDPGVPNWLDTVGRTTGIIYGRWTKCSSNPTPTVTRVKIEDVRKYLPADTPIVTAEERGATIRLRRKGVQMRRRW
jgi:Protein of unknown function (DUF1214)